MTSAARPVIGIAMATIEGGVICHQEIGREAARRGVACPEIVAHSLSSAVAREIPLYFKAGQHDRVWPIFVDAIARLHAAGATLAVIPANLAHYAFDQISQHAALPLISIVEVVARHTAASGFTTLGVLGTRAVMAGGLYDAVLAARGLRAVLPCDADMELVDQIIFRELIFGRVFPASVQRLHEVLHRLDDAGAQAVVLGCTELPMVLADQSVLPVIDSTRLLAHAALDAAQG